MSEHISNLEIVEMLESQLEDLASIVSQFDDDSDETAADARLDRWKSRTSKLISDQIDVTEGNKLSELRLGSSYIGQPAINLKREVDLYKGFLRAMKEDIERHPDYLAVPQSISASEPESIIEPVISTRMLTSNNLANSVFLVHGHDDSNLQRLETLLKERWQLTPIILRKEAAQGRTLIEKFEEEAAKARFAFVLLTPDDLVENPDGTHAQSRPNVVFELGWFYGRLGRKNVCILRKRGTAIHSDLAGINRVEFIDSIDEAFLQIELELKAGGLI